MGSSAGSLSLSEARRMAIAAQGLHLPRPRARPTAAAIAGVIHRLGLLQLDFVNVLLPAHYLVLYSRLGMYDKGLFHDLVYRRREFTEQWAHEASIVPMSSWPLLDHRRKTHRVRPYGFEQFLHSYPHYVARVLDHVRVRGPLTAEDIPETEGVPRKIPGGWHSSAARAVLEAHFGQGRLAVADRRPNFARAYDLAERIVPPHHYQRRAETHAAQRELLEKAALACGIATAADLADYYRIEIFVPAARRRWGYYVLPFLLGERMAARVDLKADRAAATLQVLSCHLEPGVDPGEVARSLSSELQTLAMWLGLAAVRVHGRGIPARALAAALR
ncbi:MAG: winged helix DNA-binding domain-containing protein [Bryobacterales bacterium]|nr:winged helix DNA-binding domain-containing protein [Bryobacterales bacterium]